MPSIVPSTRHSLSFYAASATRIIKTFGIWGGVSWDALSISEVEPCEVIKDRSIKEQAVETVEEAAVSRQYARGILCIGTALHRTLGQISQNSNPCHNHSQRHRVRVGQFREK